jgi:hypothetical protein
MARPPKKIPELPSATSSSANDFIVIEKIGVSSNTTSKITANTLVSSVVLGPFTDDAVANTNGVALGDLYYTADGSIKKRLA